METTFAICTPFMLHATQTLIKALVTVSDAFTSHLVSLHGHWKRVNSRNARLRISPRGKKASQPANRAQHSHFRNVESGTCSLRCSVHQYGVHGVHAFIIIASLACSVDNRIHDCTLSHNLESYSIKTSTRFSLNNAGPPSTLIRWSLGRPKPRSQKIGDPKKGRNSAYFYSIRKFDS